MCIYLPGDVSDLNSACYKTAPVIKSTTVEHKDGRPTTQWTGTISSEGSAFMRSTHKCDLCFLHKHESV